MMMEVLIDLEQVLRLGGREIGGGYGKQFVYLGMKLLQLHLAPSIVHNLMLDKKVSQIVQIPILQLNLSE